ncbi:MAG: SpoIIE family protein phosphatase [Planctomycetes bacterium]|nr:SpoIIE family protein phosphatase [Planctomycetota bacterium]
MDILVVDDDALSLRLLIALVEKLGHHPISATDGLSAWELYRKHDCRVVISDWNMPGLDGIELLTRIRSLPGLGYTYFIMLTSRSDREDVTAGMAAGADDLLIKPVSRDDLDARLNVARRIVSLQQEVSQRNQELSAVNERMRQDLQAAVRVQEALLPVHLPRIAGLEFAWLYRPCDQLGGDTLNLYRLDEHHLGFYVLDVSGHGVSSALLAVQVSRFLSPLIAAGALPKRAIEQVPGYRLAAPLEVVRELNELFPMSDAAMQYFTIIYGHYHIPSHTIHLASAGHPGPIVTHRDIPATVYDLSSNPIGFFPNDSAQFAEASIAIAPGDRIHFISDGVVETMSETREILGLERLASLLTTVAGEPVAVAQEHLVEALTRWRGATPPTDDVSIVTIERRG